MSIVLVVISNYNKLNFFNILDKSLTKNSSSHIIYSEFFFPHFLSEKIKNNRRNIILYLGISFKCALNLILIE